MFIANSVAGIVIFLIWFGIHEAYSEDELEFWERNPAFDDTPTIHRRYYSETEGKSRASYVNYHVRSGRKRLINDNALTTKDYKTKHKTKKGKTKKHSKHGNKHNKTIDKKNNLTFRTNDGSLEEDHSSSYKSKRKHRRKHKKKSRHHTDDDDRDNLILAHKQSDKEHKTKQKKKHHKRHGRSRHKKTTTNIQKQLITPEQEDQAVSLDTFLNVSVTKGLKIQFVATLNSNSRIPEDQNEVTPTESFILQEWEGTTKPKPTKEVIREAGKKYKHHKRLHKQNTKTTQPEKAKNIEDFGAELSPYSISRHIKKLMTQFPKFNITQEVIGKTVDYNDIVLLKITSKCRSLSFRAEDEKFVNEPPPKQIVFIVHGLNVMGIKNLSCLYKVDQFLRLMKMYLAHLDKFDLFFIPMANPDGFTVAMEDIIWNKNTSPQNACPGVAVDRNFDVAWNISRKTSSCSQQYPGPAPFSEIESNVIRDIINKYNNKMVAYLNVHGGTYADMFFKGDAVLYPKGYTEVQSEEDRYIDLRGEIDEAIKNASFSVMSVHVDTLHSWYGKVAGSSVDYASTVYGLPYSMELVMQSYDDDIVQDLALEEIWKRVIDVIFNNMYNKFKKDMGIV